MGLMDLFSRGANGVKEVVLSTMSWVGGDSSGGGFAKGSSAKYLLTPKENTTVYACVTKIANAFQEAPMVVQRKNEDGVWENDQDSTLLRGFNMQPWLSMGEIQQYQAMHIELTGKSFVWLWRDGFNDVAEAWPVPPTWVEPVYATNSMSVNGESDQRIVSHWKITIQSNGGGGGKSYTVPVEDMVYTRYIDPANLYDGLSPLDAAYHSVQISSKVDDYVNNSVNNLNIPSIVVSSEKVMSEKQHKELRDTLREKMGDAAGKRAISLEGTGAKIDTLDPLKDFDFNALGDSIDLRICSVFHVPPIVVGVKFGLANSPWSNTEEAKKDFYRSKMSAVWKIFGVSLTRHLIPEDERSSLRIAYDLTDVTQLHADRTVVHAEARELYNDSIATLDETRAKVGLVPLAQGGDVIKIGFNTRLVPIEQLVDELVLTNTDEEHNAGSEEE